MSTNDDARGGSNRHHRPSGYLRARRWSTAAILAAIEMLYIVAERPHWFVASAAILAVLALSAWGAYVLQPGLWRDALVVIGLAQAFVLLIPVAINASVSIGLMLAVIVVVAVAVVAFRKSFLA